LRLEILRPKAEVRSNVRKGVYAASNGVRDSKNEPEELPCPLCGLLALVALVGNFLCPGQEERTLRETEIHIGNSRLIAKPSLFSTTF
jgi:hypothetical protein